MIGKKEFHCEDEFKGAAYWLELFSQFPELTYFTPYRPRMMTIDFSDRKAAAVAASGQREVERMDRIKIHHHICLIFISYTLYDG